MDQIKIGKFISERRHVKKITQSELAEKLGISDRAVSKWENGICLPDASNMIELCEILGITINDLFSGEKVDMKNNEKKLEENFVNLKEREEIANRKLLNLEWVIGTTCSASFIALIFIASYLEMEDIARAILIGGAIIIFMVGIIACMKIEREVGYYECGKCHNKYIPTNIQIWFSMHMGRTRYMKCPKCEEKSWNKKVLTK